MSARTNGKQYEITEIACNGLDRVDVVGSGLGCFVVYRNVKEPDGTLRREPCGQVLAPLDSIPEAINLMLSALLEAGMSRAVSTARTQLGRIFH